MKNLVKLDFRTSESLRTGIYLIMVALYQYVFIYIYIVPPPTFLRSLKEHVDLRQNLFSGRCYSKLSLPSSFFVMSTKAGKIGFGMIFDAALTERTGEESVEH